MKPNKSLTEIKVTPTTPFPLKVTHDTFDRIAKSLTQRGYTWVDKKPIESINPWKRKERWLTSLNKDEVGYLIVSSLDPKVLQFLPNPDEYMLTREIDRQKKIHLMQRLRNKEVRTFIILSIKLS